MMLCIRERTFLVFLAALFLSRTAVTSAQSAKTTKYGGDKIVKDLKGAKSLFKETKKSNKSGKKGPTTGKRTKKDKKLPPNDSSLEWALSFSTFSSIPWSVDSEYWLWFPMDPSESVEFVSGSSPPQELLVTHLPHFLSNMSNAQQRTDGQAELTFYCGSESYQLGVEGMFFTFQNNTLNFKLLDFAETPPFACSSSASSSLSGSFPNQPVSFDSNIQDKQYYSSLTKIAPSEWSQSSCGQNHEKGVRAQQLVVQGSSMVYILSEIRCNDNDNNKFKSMKCLTATGQMYPSMEFALVNRQPMALGWDCYSGHYEYDVNPNDYDKLDQWQGQWVLPNPDGEHLTWVAYRVGNNHRVYYSNESIENTLGLPDQSILFDVSDCLQQSNGNDASDGNVAFNVTYGPEGIWFVYQQRVGNSEPGALTAMMYSWETLENANGADYPCYSGGTEDGTCSCADIYASLSVTDWFSSDNFMNAAVRLNPAVTDTSGQSSSDYFLLMIIYDQHGNRPSVTNRRALSYYVKYDTQSWNSLSYKQEHLFKSSDSPATLVQTGYFISQAYQDQDKYVYLRFQQAGLNQANGIVVKGKAQTSMSATGNPLLSLEVWEPNSTLPRYPWAAGSALIAVATENAPSVLNGPLNENVGQDVTQDRYFCGVDFVSVSDSKWDQYWSCEFDSYARSIDNTYVENEQNQLLGIILGPTPIAQANINLTCALRPPGWAVAQTQLVMGTAASSGIGTSTTTSFFTSESVALGNPKLGPSLAQQFKQTKSSTSTVTEKGEVSVFKTVMDKFDASTDGSLSNSGLLVWQQVNYGGRSYALYDGSTGAQTSVYQSFFLVYDSDITTESFELPAPPLYLTCEAPYPIVGEPSTYQDPSGSYSTCFNEDAITAPNGAVTRLEYSWNPSGGSGTPVTVKASYATSQVETVEYSESIKTSMNLDYLKVNTEIGTSVKNVKSSFQSNSESWELSAQLTQPAPTDGQGGFYGFSEVDFDLWMLAPKQGFTTTLLQQIDPSLANRINGNSSPWVIPHVVTNLQPDPSEMKSC